LRELRLLQKYRELAQLAQLAQIIRKPEQAITHNPICEALK
jgi:hypothetical protein